jgi:hypothetical protein
LCLKEENALGVEGLTHDLTIITNVRNAGELFWHIGAMLKEEMKLSAHFIVYVYALNVHKNLV